MPGIIGIIAGGYHLLCVQSPKVNLVRYMRYNHQSITGWRKAEICIISRRICESSEILAIFQVPSFNDILRPLYYSQKMPIRRKAGK